MPIEVPVQVSTFRNAGLEAKWSKLRNGCPIIVLRDPNSEHVHMRTTWWFLTRQMHNTMKEVGIREGFERHTLLGDMFSVPV